MKSGPYLIEVTAPVPAQGVAPSSEPEFLTAEEAASLLRLSPKTVRAYVAEGKIPGAKYIGKEIRIHRPTLVASFAPASEMRPRRRNR